MRKNYTKFAKSVQLAARLQLVERLAAQPTTASLESQAGQILSKTRNGQPIGDLRSILINATTGNGSRTQVIEVSEAAEVENFRDNAQIDYEMHQAESIPDSWYTINSGDYTAKVNRYTGKVSYE